MTHLTPLLLLAWTACGSPSSPGADGGVDAAVDSGVVAECRTGRSWSAGNPAYVERTSEWGLGGLQSSWLAGADLDGDGYEDLVVITNGAVARGLPRVFMNRAAAGGARHLVDETHASGLTTARDGADGRYFSLATFGDVDNDGDLDAYTGVYVTDHASRMGNTDAAEVLLNDGSGHFTLTASPATAAFEPADPREGGAFFLDHDRDGLLDLFMAYWWAGAEPFTIPYGQFPLLLAGDGTGVFTDVSEARGFTFTNTDVGVANGTATVPIFGATGCDVSGDARPDILLAAYGRFWNQAWISTGATDYVNRGRMDGVAADDRLDYSDDQSYRCYCQAHPGTCPATVMAPDPRFSCPARGWNPGSSDQPWTLGGNTFSFSCGDVDNDGDMDLYSSEIRHPDVGFASDPSELLINDGAGTFTRPGREAMGLAPPVDLTSTDEGGQNGGIFDFDDDGWLDVYLGASPYDHNRAWLFHQNPPTGTWTGSFEYIGAAAGFDHACPSSMALADFDHDGDEDIAVATYGCAPDYGGGTMPMQPVAFYENVSHENNWTSLRLVGTGGSNRSAIGARVRVTAGGVTRTREVFDSWGRASMSRDIAVHVGLGASCTIDSIEIRWPDATSTMETWTTVVANHRVELRQGDPAVHYLE